MKKVFLFAALAIALHSCKSGDESGKKTETTTTTTAETSIVGKWRVVDMTMKPEPGQELPKPEVIREKAAKDSMIFEFMPNGDAKSSSAYTPVVEGKYTKTGDVLEVTFDVDKKEFYKISNLTAKSMTLKMTGEKEVEDMAMIFEKM